MKRDSTEPEQPRQPDAPREVALAFRAVVAQVVLHNYAVAETVGLSPRDMQAIHLLQLRGSMSPGELGRALGLASASMTALIDRLENAGYARRERDPDDRRKLVVSLVASRLERDLAPRYAAQAEQLQQVIGDFNPRELQVIHRFLKALADTG
jgi:DNA-binding MarR family transcriptional regulator